MSKPPPTDEQLAHAAKAYKEHGCNKGKASRALDMPITTFGNYIKLAAERGLLLDVAPAMPGFAVKSLSQQTDEDGNVVKEWTKQAKEPGDFFEMPPGHIVKGVSAYTDAEGRVIYQWIKTKEDPAGFDWSEVFKSAFAEYEGRAKPVAAPKDVDKDFLNLIPCNDWHINLLCWWREVGESWDLKIAEKVIGDNIDAAIKRARPAGTAVVLGGGDLMHNDDNTNRTAKSHNLLDADGRHTKGIEVAQRLKVRTIDAALVNNKEVIVRILKGNHDEQSSVAISHFLAAWYRNEPRVKVDLDQSLFWHYRFGKVMLAATHGHAAKLATMPGIMAHRRPEDWGATRYRYAHGFHYHHREKTATEGNGVICECHQAPIPADTFSFGEGYLAGRSIQVISYHKDRGENGRVIEAIAGYEGQRKDGL